MAGGPVMRLGRAAVLAAAVFAVCLLAPVAARAEIVVTVDKAKQRMFVVVERRAPLHVAGVDRPRQHAERLAIGRNCCRAIIARRCSTTHRCRYAIFYSGHYAIHGTTAVAQLGIRASKGCVRLHPSNAAVLFALVQQHGPANTRILIQDSVTRVAQR